MGTVGARGWRRVAVAVAVGTVAALGAAGAAHADAGTAGTPCSPAARACVDLGARQAWLVRDGAVLRGPVPISSGGPQRETPRGTFAVEWKNRHHTSSEFDGAPMPFAVFFAEGGIAFHEGDLNSPSAGCVRLAHEDAAAFYDVLQVGDRVEVV